MIDKNEEYEGVVEGYATDGEGIIKAEGEIGRAHV